MIRHHKGRGLTATGLGLGLWTGRPAVCGLAPRPGWPRTACDRYSGADYLQADDFLWLGLRRTWVAGTPGTCLLSIQV